MKKTYITPKMKAMKVQASTIICTSQNSFKLNSESVSATSEYDDDEGYDVAW